MDNLDTFYNEQRKQFALKHKSKSFKKRLLRKLRYKNLFDPRIKYPEIKFVIYTRGRTGSTMLTNLLGCHPDLYCDNEIFNFDHCFTRVHFPYLYIKSFSKKATLAKKSIYGFKVKISQLRYEHHYKNYDKILKKLSREGWKFIHLKRENFLKHQLSNLLAAETKTFLIKNPEETVSKKLNLDCSDMMARLIESEEINRTEEDNLKDIPHIKIYYEKDLLDNSRHQQTADKIFQYLGIDSYPVKTVFEKLNSDNLSDLVLNFEEVNNFFKDTEYAEFLK